MSRYEWPLWVFSFLFFFFSFFLFFSENSLFYHFWLNKEKSVLFWLPLFLLSIGKKLIGKRKSKMSSYPKGLLWNYLVYFRRLALKIHSVYHKCYQLVISKSDQGTMSALLNTASHVTHMPWSAELDWCGQWLTSGCYGSGKAAWIMGNVSCIWLIHLRRVQKSLRFPLQHLESGWSVRSKPELEGLIKVSLRCSDLI